MKARAACGRNSLKTTAQSTVLLGGDEDFCAERFGYERYKKGITAGFAPKPLSDNARIQNVWFAEYLPRFGFSIVVSRSGQVYQWKTTDEGIPRPSGAFTTVRPYVVSAIKDGQYIYYVNSGQRAITISSSAIANLRPATMRNTTCCGVMHCGRIYARDYDNPYTLYWTGNNVTEWEEDGQNGGHLRLDDDCGGITDIVDMGEKLALVRETGLTLISVHNDTIHMRVEPVASRRLPPVIENASAACGGALYICTKDGLYAYSGGNILRLNDVFRAEGYHVEAARQFNGNRVLFTFAEDGVAYSYDKFFVEYDPAENSYTPFGKGCHTPFLIGNEYHCFNGIYISTLSKTEEDENRRWVSKPVDLGTPNAKMLKRITVEASGNPTVEIACDGRTHTFKGAGRRTVGECGHAFTFIVKGVCEVTRLTAEWEVR